MVGRCYILSSNFSLEISLHEGQWAVLALHTSDECLK